MTAQGQKLAPIKTQSLSHPRTIFAVLLGLATTFCGLRRKMAGYTSTKEARPSAVLTVDTLDLEGISRSLEEGIFTSEALVDVRITHSIQNYLSLC